VSTEFPTIVLLLLEDSFQPHPVRAVMIPPTIIHEAKYNRMVPLPH
jgi:hypothetical protein